jgi:hypothetical protein
MKIDEILKCLIAFVMGYLIARMFRGDGLNVGGSSYYDVWHSKCKDTSECYPGMECMVVLDEQGRPKGYSACAAPNYLPYANYKGGFCNKYTPISECMSTFYDPYLGDKSFCHINPNGVCEDGGGDNTSCIETWNVDSDGETYKVCSGPTQKNSNYEWGKYNNLPDEYSTCCEINGEQSKITPYRYDGGPPFSGDGYDKRDNSCPKNMCAVIQDDKAISCFYPKKSDKDCSSPPSPSPPPPSPTPPAIELGCCTGKEVRACYGRKVCNNVIRGDWVQDDECQRAGRPCSGPPAP